MNAIDLTPKQKRERHKANVERARRARAFQAEWQGLVECVREFIETMPVDVVDLIPTYTALYDARPALDDLVAICDRIKDTERCTPNTRANLSQIAPETTNPPT